MLPGEELREYGKNKYFMLHTERKLKFNFQKDRGREARGDLEEIHQDATN